MSKSQSLLQGLHSLLFPSLPFPSLLFPSLPFPSLPFPSLLRSLPSPLPPLPLPFLPIPFLTISLFALCASAALGSAPFGSAWIDSGRFSLAWLCSAWLGAGLPRSAPLGFARLCFRQVQLLLLLSSARLNSAQVLGRCEFNSSAAARAANLLSLSRAAREVLVSCARRACVGKRCGSTSRGWPSRCQSEKSVAALIPNCAVRLRALPMLLRAPRSKS